MPELLLPALEKIIAARQLKAVHLFVGEDVRLVERLVDAVESTVEPADRPFAVERIYAGEPGGSPLDIADAARMFPMLGDRRIVIVLRAERLLKPKRASKAGDADEAREAAAEEADALELGPLESYLGFPKKETGKSKSSVKAPSPVSLESSGNRTTLLFVASDVDRGRAFTKNLLTAAYVTEFGGIGGVRLDERREARAAAAEIARAELSAAGRSIDPAALSMLIERAAGHISKLRGHIERLVLYTEGRPRISREDVAEIAPVDALVDPFALVNAIGDGDTGRALRELVLRLDHGDVVFAIVGQLRWWVTSRLAERDPERVRPAIEALLRTDLALKSSGGEARVLMEQLVVELAGKPLAREALR